MNALHDRLADEDAQDERDQNNQDQHFEDFTPHLLGGCVGLFGGLLNEDAPIEVADVGVGGQKTVFAFIGEFDGAGARFFRGQGRRAHFGRRVFAEQRSDVRMGHQTLLGHIDDVDIAFLINDQVLDERA